MNREPLQQVALRFWRLSHLKAAIEHALLAGEFDAPLSRLLDDVLEKLERTREQVPELRRPAEAA